MASRPAACMPAAMASRPFRYSSGEIEGISLPTACGGPGWGLRLLDRRSVGGKSANRLRDLLRARHEEVLLRSIERHRRDVRRRDPHDWSIQAVESVLGDDRGDPRPESAPEVVLVDHYRLA